MAHFAKIGLNNTVLDVIRIDTINSMTPEGVEIESIGVEYLTRLFGHSTWVKCSFNTQQGQHLNGGTPFRKNFPSPGWTYDSERDAFVQPRPANYPSWIFNEDTCCWETPVPRPSNPESSQWGWNEDKLAWEDMT
jgi:hypothetical protein